MWPKNYVAAGFEPESLLLIGILASSSSLAAFKYPLLDEAFPKKYNNVAYTLKK